MNIEAFPSRVVLELTPLCNLSCAMCPRHYVKEGDGYMPPELFKKLVDEVARENPSAVILPFWRGESCLHPDFVELLQYALDKGMRIHLSTNGHFVGPEFAEIFFHCEFLTFSLHTKRGYNNAKRFIADKPSWSTTTVQVSFVDSEKSAERYLDQCRTDPRLLGFDCVRLYVEHTIDGEFGRSAEQTYGERTFCPKLNHTFVVSADGRFSRCNHIWNPDGAGDLRRETIAGLWMGRRMNEIRSSYPDGQCVPCAQWSGHTTGEAWRKEQGRVVHINYGKGR